MGESTAQGCLAKEDRPHSPILCVVVGLCFLRGAREVFDTEICMRLGEYLWSLRETRSKKMPEEVAAVHTDR